MEKRELLFKEAITLIENSTPLKESILYHNIYTVNMNGVYPFSTREDVLGLVKFLNLVY
ncbi:hypothetical protein [Maribellus sp. YY47]|uniref:hypothetical protein n=1 Tax=Maribellus sp. YY47 TaxID=2929486 RepID=UPI002001C103|nr:hypothetical protein [Maribellus sp. YY47]MCK3684817.1 hypothetical protein [Maribellus sp. YY47]